MRETYFIGVDGGGTRTRVAIANSTGTVLGIGHAGPGNYHDVGIDAVRDHVARALAEAWRHGRAQSRQAEAAFLGMASVVTDADRRAIREVALDLGLAPRSRQIGVDHDLRIALAGGLVGAEGIALIAGTGCSCYGRTAEGRTWKAGGWGPVIDDRGSAYWLGIQALHAAARAFDGRGEATELMPRVLHRLGVADLNGLMYRVDAVGMGRRDVAELAQEATAAAEAGDLVATMLLQQAAAELAALVSAVAAHLSFSCETIPVSITGGLSKAGEIFLGPLRAQLSVAVPRAQLRMPAAEPVIGALLLAAQLISVDVTPQLLDALLCFHGD